jgi:hypothetical protein
MIALYVDGRVDLDARLEDIEAAIHGLDGAARTLVVVELPSGSTLTVGGGPDQVVAEVATSRTEHWCVVDRSRPAGTVEMVVGGQRVQPPARVCIDKEAALEAARAFVSGDGARSARLEWSVEG